MPETVEPIDPSVERVQRTFYIDRALYREIKIMTAARGITISDAINDALVTWLKAQPGVVLRSRKESTS